jgi:hypothetical protein
VDATTLRLFSSRLANENLEDVLAACHKLGELPRQEGDPSFPAVETILSMVEVMQTARKAREAPERYLVAFQCKACKLTATAYYASDATLPTRCNVWRGGIPCGGELGVMVDERPRQ